MTDREDDGPREIDLIAKAPVLNTTADTAAKLANGNFQPDYIIEHPAPAAKPRRKGPAGPADAGPAAPAQPPP